MWFNLNIRVCSHYRIDSSRQIVSSRIYAQKKKHDVNIAPRVRSKSSERETNINELAARSKRDTLIGEYYKEFNILTTSLTA